ncbi:MAG: hypothetical protein EOO47_08475 [Flavobacterium sp.]|nr:MAG: hypothetical protein EOO47_08475 [Flavobacterium sp.]
MIFKEEQKLNLWWLYILLGIEAIMVLSITFFAEGGISWQKLQDIYFAPILGAMLPFIIVYIIQQNKFNLEISQDGVRYRFWPFSRKTRHIPYSSIEAMYIRKYDALGEYGGWGSRYRLWFKLKDKAYIFNDGNKGLQLELKGGKKLLFSITDIDSLTLFLINIKRTHHLEAIATDVR